MKATSTILLILVSFFLLGAGASAAPIIANHATTRLSDVPLWAINNAKEDLHIAFGHTSHGSQIITGMNGLTTFANAPNGGSTYAWNTGGTGGALYLRDDLGGYDMPYGAADLGNPDYSAWATATRKYLTAHPEVNVIMWSWCGQADTTSANIDKYLSLMNQLEKDFPQVKFVYMTGHLVGTGTSGNLNLRNEQIRAYARANNKILYDFADIESYDPDGLVNYMSLKANDNCDYTKNSVSHNWATEWQNSHTKGVDWYSCEAAHSQPLNANQKAYAAWWLWARLAGWDGTPVGSSPVITPTPVIKPTTVITPIPGIPSAPGTDTVGFYQKSTGMFFLKNRNSAGDANMVFHYGAGGNDWSPLVGDWNNNGVDTVGQYQQSTGMFFLKNSNSAGDANMAFPYGAGGDDWVQLAGDWDGDGDETIGAYQKSIGTFFLKNSNAAGDATTVFRFGWSSISGDLVPLAGDWDGDGDETVGLYEKSTGTFLLKNSNTGGNQDMVFRFGWSSRSGDLVPLAGDWDGDGDETVGLYEKSTGTYLLKNSNSAGNQDMLFQYGWGSSSGDLVPLVGHWV